MDIQDFETLNRRRHQTHQLSLRDLAITTQFLAFARSQLQYHSTLNVFNRLNAAKKVSGHLPLNLVETHTR